MATANGTQVHRNVQHHKSAEKAEVVLSPYTSQPINVKIGPNGANHYILQAMVEQYPSLKARMNTKKAGSPIELPEVDEEVAHIFTHFIYTQHYQSQGLGGIPENVRAVAELKRSVLAYCAARHYSIAQLEEVTKAKMAHFVKQVSFFDLQDTIPQVSARLPANEVWFPEHLYQWVKSLLVENDQLVADERLYSLIGKSNLFDKAVFRSLAEMYCEKSAAFDVVSTRKRNDSVMDGDATPTAPVEPINSTEDDPAPATDVSPEEKSIEEPLVATSTEVLAEEVEDPEMNTPQIILEEESDPSSTTLAASTCEAELMGLDPASDSKDDELAKVESASKATDSDVEEARKKSISKKKKKNKKKSSAETQIATQAVS